MVAVIDLSLESDGWLSGGNGEGICAARRQSAARNVFHGKNSYRHEDECVGGQAAFHIDCLCVCVERRRDKHECPLILFFFSFILVYL